MYYPEQQFEKIATMGGRYEIYLNYSLCFCPTLFCHLINYFVNAVQYPTLCIPYENPSQRNFYAQIKLHVLAKKTSCASQEGQPMVTYFRSRDYPSVFFLLLLLLLLAMNAQEYILGMSSLYYTLLLCQKQISNTDQQSHSSEQGGEKVTGDPIPRYFCCNHLCYDSGLDDFAIRSSPICHFRNLVGQFYYYHCLFSISLSTCPVSTTEQDEKQLFLAHECKNSKWNMLGRSICNDTYIPIFVSLPSSIRDRGWEYLHLQATPEIQQYFKQGAISSRHFVYPVCTHGLDH